MSKSNIYFSTFVVNKQIFYKSAHSYALVNLKPLVPGHVLIVPYRVVPRLKDLTPIESQDYFETLQRVHRFIEHQFKADSLNIAIQDGKAAGQSVPHLHTHIIPRYLTDGEGDAVYKKIEDNEAEMQEQFQASRARPFDVPDEERVPRSAEVMAAEADWLAQQMAQYESQYADHVRAAQ